MDCVLSGSLLVVFSLFCYAMCVFFEQINSLSLSLLAVLPVFSGRLSLLTVPRTNLTFGSRSFRVTVPAIWNSLPDSTRLSDTVNSFWRHLKTRLYLAAFNTLAANSSASDSLDSCD